MQEHMEKWKCILFRILNKKQSKVILKIRLQISLFKGCSSAETSGSVMLRDRPFLTLEMRLVDQLFVSVQVISNYFIWVTDNPLLLASHNDIRGSLLKWLSCYLPAAIGKLDFPFVQGEKWSNAPDKVQPHKGP